MITDHAGVTWGTKTEIAQALCLDPTAGPELVRSWGRRGRIPTRHIPGPGRGTILYPLAQAELEEQRARRSGAGRPRGA